MKLLAKNEGALDRGFRVVLGVGLLSLVFFGPHTALGWIGIVPLLTGAIGSCPLYNFVGMNTCSRK
jgi:Protein of unknown function (DUF2892)